jgi:hypothetical protein
MRNMKPSSLVGLTSYESCQLRLRYRVGLSRLGARSELPRSCPEEPAPEVDRPPTAHGSDAGGEEDLRQWASRAHSGRRIATSLSAHR